MTNNANLIDKCRAAFEESMSSQGEWPQAVDRFPDGGYKLATTASAWEVWQTAWEAALQSQDREDAQRYRWLRENWFTMGSTYKDDQIQFYINGPRYSNATEAELDAAIDHARRVEEGWE